MLREKLCGKSGRIFFLHFTAEWNFSFHSCAAIIIRLSSRDMGDNILIYLNNDT